MKGIENWYKLLYICMSYVSIWTISRFGLMYLFTNSIYLIYLFTNSICMIIL